MVLLLILIAVICYALGNLSGGMILSRFVFRRKADKYFKAQTSITEFGADFGAAGAVALVVFEILKAVIAVLLGGLLLGIKDNVTVGRLFAAFCLVMGQAFPVMFNFRGSRSLLAAGVAAFFVDWRVGLCCWVAYIVIVIFTRYAALASVVSAVLASIFLWIFGFTGLEGTLALLTAVIFIIRYAENIVRMVGGSEPKVDIKGIPSKKPADPGDSEE